ncbi:MAG: hypothetical protein H6Q86_5395, partial [candidate division NC10 bacterium]|nr:hypothetical protein [candidate division NC10 bacterium]
SALHLDLFEQPVTTEFFGNVLTLSGQR